MLKAKMKTFSSILSLIVVICMLLSTLASCGNDEPVPGIPGAQGDPGEPGKDGEDGETPYIGDNRNWWIGDLDTGVSAYANDGKDGKDGKNGKDGVDGASGEDGVTPKFSFDEVTNILSVSYDDGASWSLMIDLNGMCRDGKDGVDGKDGINGTNGKDGVNGITPILSVNEVTNYWMVSYDNGATWNSLNVLATGEKGDPGKDGVDGVDGKNGVDGTNGQNGVDGVNGKDGVTPQLRINAATFNWEVSYDNGEKWEDLGISAVGKNGATGEPGKDGLDGNDGKDGETPEIYLDGTKLCVKYPSRDGAVIYDFSSVTDVKDGVTPQLRINAETLMWEVSYDNGNTWDSMGVSASGKDGIDGANGADGAAGKDGIDGAPGKNGEDGKTPHLIVEGNILYVYYDNIEEKAPVYDFSNISSGNGGENGADGKDGKDGITPLLKIDELTNIWMVSYDNGANWTSLNVAATGEKGDPGKDGAAGKDGSDGIDGENGRGIEKVWLDGGSLVVKYTDGEIEVVGTVNGGSVEEGDADVVTNEDVYTDALDFYPMNNGDEYGVRIGRAIYMSVVKIPATYNGKPVTTILSGFSVGANTELLILPETITTIQSNAFVGIMCVEVYASVGCVETNAFVGALKVIVKGADSLPEGWPEFTETEVIYQKENN